MTELHEAPDDEPMYLNDLTDTERALITSLRSEDRDTATEAMRSLIWEHLAPMFEPDEPSVNNPRYNNLRRTFAQGFAAVILVGNVSFPVAVQLGLVDVACDHTDPVAECAEESGL